MGLLFQIVGATTVILLVLFIGITIWHYFFYTLRYILRGKNKTVEYLSNNTIGYNLLIYLYILMLLPLLISTFLGLIDSLGFINLNEVLTNINITFNNNIEVKIIEYNIYRTVALFVSFLLILVNLLFIIKKKYTAIIKQIFIKIMQ